MAVSNKVATAMVKEAVADKVVAGKRIDSDDKTYNRRTIS